MSLLWGTENIQFGVGFIACPGDLVIHVYKLRIDHRRTTRKQPYQFRVERRGVVSGTIFDSATDTFETGGRDFREARAQAEIWHAKYKLRQGK